MASFMDTVEKSGSSRKPVDDNIIQSMRFACWITKSIDPRPEYVIIFILKATIATQTCLIVRFTVLMPVL
jgi:hypothetical protein